MSETKYMKLRTRNAKMMKMYGDKLTKSEWARSMRTNGLHTEIQHSDRYGGISQSCTMSDGCNGHRFKMIGYSHPYRWSTVYIPVTAEQEARLFAKGCEMAGLSKEWCDIHLTNFTVNVEPGETVYGKDHIKYDKGAAFFSFISKRNIWKPSKTKMICNRACGEVLITEWPDVFEIKKGEGLGFFECKVSYPIDSPAFMDDWKQVYPSIPPHEQTPDDTEYLVRHYFDAVARPTQQDINNIIKEVNKES